MSGKLKNTVKSFVLILAFLGVVGIAGTATYVYSTYQRAGTHTEDRLVYIPKGSHFGDIVRVLKQEGVLAEDRVFHIVNRVTGRHTALKAGEYEVPASASAADISRQLATGETYDRFFTVVEGQSVRQVIAQLRAEPYLRGEITRLPPEGELLPETYHYQRGDDRQDLVDQMQRDMKETLARLWEDRAPGLPLDTPYEALVLASIVEKETAIADERDHVAAVFVNRLNKGMRLQADPTVVYALTKGEGALGRKLLRRDLEIDSPYNTYRNAGLPPHPIANPSAESIQATLNPKTTQDLYFVADGSGGHIFAETLAEHNRNVMRWRQIRDEIRDARRRAAPDQSRPVSTP